MTPYNSSYGTSTMVSNVSAVMKSVYMRMALGLLVTGLLAYFCASSDAFLNYFATNHWVMWALIIAEFGLVIGINAGINKLSPMAASLLFYLFSAVNGLMLSPIFVVYTEASIAKTFFITAGTFGAMSVYGYFTNRDLTRIGSYLIMALFGLIIASVVNIFFNSTQAEWVISLIGIAIFIGLTAWDTQKIRQMAEYTPAGQTHRLATIGALSLYLDFINLFLYLLRFFGSSRD